MERRNVAKQLFSAAKEDRSLLFSFAFIFLLVVFSIFGEYIAIDSHMNIHLPEKFLPPSLKNLFGTDFLGRDVMSIIILGSRETLLVTVVPTLISATIGVSIGIISGYFGGIFDDIVQRGVDILMSFHGLLLSLAIINILGPGLWNAMWSVTISRISSYVRLSRSLTFSVKETRYVEYAKAIGTSSRRIMLRHILPNITTPIIVQLTFSMPGTLLSVAGLSYLGLGPSPPTPDWGVLMQQSRIYIMNAPWVAIIPGLFIFLVAFSFNTIGETLSDIVDPRRKYIRF